MVFCQRFILLMMVFYTHSSSASILSPWRYLMQYQLGIDVGETNDIANFNFDAHESDYNHADFCEDKEDFPELNECSIPFTQKSSNFGVFLEQPFKRQGLWHLDWDISFALRSFTGKFKREEDTPEEAAALPIRDVNLNYYGIGSRIYVTLGITPKKWPELLVSLGPTGEAMFGSAEFNDEEFKSESAIRRSRIGELGSYISIDLVFFRFKKGYAGLVFWRHSGQNDVQEGQLIPKEYETFQNLNLTLDRNFSGFKILFK